jgi:hypothetical protein
MAAIKSSGGRRLSPISRLKAPPGVVFSKFDRFL